MKELMENFDQLFSKTYELVVTVVCIWVLATGSKTVPRFEILVAIGIILVVEHLSVIRKHTQR